MPELPEVETVVRGLQNLVLGHEIRRVQVKRPRIIRPEHPRVFARQLKGHIIEEVERYGKWIAFRLSNNLTLWSHLGMTGQFRWNNPDKYVRLSIVLQGVPTLQTQSEDVIPHLMRDPGVGQDPCDPDYSSPLRSRGEKKGGPDNSPPGIRGENTKVGLHAKPSTLYFSDPRIFGRMLIDPNNKPTPPGVPMGLDPILQKVSGKYLYDQFHSRKTAIKDLLLNQEIIAGIGNIYASEILFDTQLHPLQSADSLTLKECRILAKSIDVILRQAIDWCGTTLSDARYQTLDGSSGDYQDFLKVYSRANLPCYKCNTSLERYVLHGRSGVFCPKCQK
jgi:formamidopyrimidine-DNA glycosylase